MNQERHVQGRNNDELVHVGSRVAWLRKRRGWTQRELARRCCELRKLLFAAAELPSVPHLRRDRIAKIEAAARNKGGARVVFAHELRLLAAAFNVSEEWLRGSATTGMALVCHPESLSDRAQQIAELIAFHEQFSTTRWAWTEDLPCTLQPPSFTRHHVDATVAEWANLGPPTVSRDALANALLTVANANRERTLDRLVQGSLTFFVVMPLNTLVALATSEGPYADVPAEERKACLQWVLDLIGRFPAGLKLALATKLDLAPYSCLTSSYSSLYVSGGLSSWADRIGKLYFTECLPTVEQHQGVVEAMYHRATMKDHADVTLFVLECLSLLKRQTTAFRVSRIPVVKPIPRDNRRPRKKLSARP